MARKYGTGTIYQRSSDGRWIASLPDGHGGRARYVTGTDRATVERRLREARSSTSRRKPASETVQAFLGRWLDDAAATSLRPRTAATYRTTVERHIVPAVGRIRLVDLDASDVARMVSGMLRAGYAPQTAKHAHKILRVALAQAVRWDLVPRNVAALVRAPRVVRRPVEGLTADEALRFLDATRDDPWHALYVLAITTGMRRGELLALRWQDIDLAAGTVRVEHTLRQVSAWRWAWETPKTDSSRRTLPLTRRAVEALREHRAGATSAVVVFARPDGRPLPPAEVTRTFQAALARHGIRKVRFHDMRHTAAQLLLDRMGGDIRAVSATLGHASIATTVGIYGGMADDARRRAAAAMDDVMEGHG
jgi:integrase